MILAKKYFGGKKNIPISKYAVLLLSLLCIAIYGIMGLHGGTLKLFNDIPALIGYGGFLLFIYMVNISLINRLFIKISSISYEWYLVHILVFSCTSSI
jgi:peptidoglycan/LPS O-acetylase OafA/YrhL